jgi:uncharacterized membrane protein
MTRLLSPLGLGDDVVQARGGEAHTMMRFCNNTSRRIYLSFMWYQPGCTDVSDWQYAGWWRIEPGTCTVVYENDLSDNNSYWYFYAHSDEATWSGPFPHPCPNIKFWRCDDTIGGSEVSRGFQEIYTGDNDEYTMNLNP